MVFNSLTFAIFFSIVFTVYWLLRGSYRLQNALLLIASYIFYGWWDLRFLLIISSISIVSLLAAGHISDAKSNRERKIVAWASCIFIAGMLAVFVAWGRLKAAPIAAKK